MIAGFRGGDRQARAVVVATLLILGAGALALVVALAPQRRPAPPQPSAAAVHPAATGRGLGRAAAPLPASVPTRVRIPAIGVDAPLIALGLSPDGSVATPPLDRPDEAGWYDDGPTPGEIGPAVLLGHVDSAKSGPAVFYKLGRLKPGELVAVARRDGRTAQFRVDSVERFPKTAFPTERVYGDLPYPALRLITCGGAYDRRRHEYRDNVIVFAHLIPAAS
jgi:sortase (surface protein transpeptidase)